MEPKQVHHVAGGPPHNPMARHTTIRVCAGCKRRRMAEVVARQPGWTPDNPTHPAQGAAHGYPCRSCSKWLRLKSRRCGRHIAPEDRRRTDEERASRNEYWAAKRKTYQNRRRVLNHKVRQQLLGPQTRCSACGEQPANPSDLHLDHKIPVVSVVRSGKDVDDAYVADNMWFLCKACHNVKTKGIRGPPPMEHLARTTWGRMQTRGEMVRDYEQWKESAKERERRAALISEALKASPAPNHLLSADGG